MRFIHTLQTENFILMVRDVNARNNEGTFSAPNRFWDFHSSFYRRVRPWTMETEAEVHVDVVTINCYSLPRDAKRWWLMKRRILSDGVTRNHFSEHKPEVLEILSRFWGYQPSRQASICDSKNNFNFQSSKAIKPSSQPTSRNPKPNHRLLEMSARFSVFHSSIK